ncbi:MAG: MBL fold metallo-hydrolase [Promethearchaeota archaeon]
MTELQKQLVCKKCGYNMIGQYLQFCPFCGSSYENFITAEECSNNYVIISTRITDKVLRLNSYPPLGLEHSAYSIETDNKRIWIDCPSTFSKDLEPMDKILFTHHHFLGASNLYRGYYTAFIWIHKNDAEHPISSKHPFDKKFTQNFNLSGIEATHIGGHTQGFTIYTFEGILFICDYLILLDQGFILNPYGSIQYTREGAKKINNFVEKRDITLVCGFNYVSDYHVWKKQLDKLLL